MICLGGRPITLQGDLRPLMEEDVQINFTNRKRNKLKQLENSLSRIQEYVFRDGTDVLTVYPKLTEDAKKSKLLFQARVREYADVGLVYLSDSLAVPTNINIIPKPSSVLFDACLVFPDKGTIIVSVTSAKNCQSKAVVRYNMALAREVINCFRNFIDEPFSANYGIVAESDLQTKELFCTSVHEMVCHTSKMCIPDSLVTDKEKYEKIIKAVLWTVALSSSVHNRDGTDTSWFLTLDQFRILTENIDQREVTLKTDPSSGRNVLMREVASRLEKSGPTMLLVDSKQKAERARKLKSCTLCYTLRELCQTIKENGILSGLKNVVTNYMTLPFASRISGSLWQFTSTEDSTMLGIPRTISDEDIFLDRNSGVLDADFVETSAYQYARTTLITHGHVTLIGEAGSGKTTTALQLLRENRHNCNTVVVRGLADLRDLRYSKIPTLVLVDDMFGTGVFVPEYFTDMIRILQQLEMRTKTKNFKLILTSRSHVFREAMNRCTMNVDFAFSYNTTVDLSSEKTLSVFDKSALLNRYLDLAGVNRSTVNRDAIASMKTTFSFPLACFMFSQMPVWHNRALMFFSEVLPVYNGQVEQLRHFDPGKFIVLLLVLLKGTLNLENLQTNDVDLKKALSFSGILDANEFLQELEQILNALCGSFLTRDGVDITLRNKTIAGALVYVAGSIDSCFVVKNCSLDTLYGRITIQDERVSDSDLYHIALTEQEMKVLIDRFTSEIIKGSFALICTHETCTNKVFVEDLMEATLTHTEGLTALKNKEDIAYNETFLHWTVIGGSKVLLESLLRKVDFGDIELKMPS